MTNSVAKSSGFSNANTGALFFNGAPMSNACLTGEWRNAAGAKHGLGISADNDGVRQIAVLTGQGGLLSKGTVTRVKSGKGGKGPAYRGTLGSLKIVLWAMDGYYQVRVDAGVPQRTVSTAALDFLGATLTVKPHVVTKSTTDVNAESGSDLPF
jgi:hypothetical protein